MLYPWCVTRARAVARGAGPFQARRGDDRLTRGGSDIRAQTRFPPRSTSTPHPSANPWTMTIPRPPSPREDGPLSRCRSGQSTPPKIGRRWSSSRTLSFRPRELAVIESSRTTCACTAVFATNSLTIKSALSASSSISRSRSQPKTALRASLGEPTPGRSRATVLHKYFIPVVALTCTQNRACAHAHRTYSCRFGSCGRRVREQTCSLTSL